MEVEIKEYPVKTYLLKNGRHPHSYRLLKLALIEKYKVCFWCNVPVYDHPMIKKQPSLPDTATIDHLKTRFERKKGEIVGRNSS